MSELKRYAVARVGGDIVQVVDPAHFYAAPCAVAARGLGLFCRVALVPGDVWWAHDFNDPRYVTRIIPWAEYTQLDAEERRSVERLCYIDSESRSLIFCAEPFCRVNHAGADANSVGADSGNSVVSRPIPAGTEITQFYDFELLISLLWKFPEIRNLLPPEVLADDEVLFTPATAHPPILAFLRTL